MVKHQHKVFFRGAFKQFFQRATVFDELVVAAGDGYVAESERAVFEDGKAGVFKRLDVFVDFAAIVFMVADNGQIGGFAVDFSEFGGEVQRAEMVGGTFDNVAGETVKSGLIRLMFSIILAIWFRPRPQLSICRSETSAKVKSTPVFSVRIS